MLKPRLSWEYSHVKEGTWHENSYMRTIIKGKAWSSKRDVWPLAQNSNKGILWFSFLKHSLT